LRPMDATDELRDLGEKDSELANWLKKRVEFDEHVAEALGAVPIPTGLRDRLLSGSPEVKKGPLRMRWLRPVLAMAACVAFCAVIFLRFSPGMTEWQVEALRAAVEMENGKGSFDVKRGSLDGISRYLTEVGARKPGQLPSGLVAARSLGCRRVQIGGHSAVLICFMLKSGKEAHLIVIDTGSLPGLPPPGKTEFDTNSKWNLATWTDGSQSYFLASTEDTTELKKLVEHT
jgi:hypothetical protein